MRRRFPVILTTVLSLAALQCSDSVSPFAIDLSGTWAFADVTLYSNYVIANRQNNPSTGSVARSGTVIVTPALLDTTRHVFQASYILSQFDSVPGQPAFRSPPGYTTATGLIDLTGDSIKSLVGLAVPREALIRPGLIIWTIRDSPICRAFLDQVSSGTTPTCQTHVWWQLSAH